MSAVHLVDSNRLCITGRSPPVLYTPKSLPTTGISSLWKIQRFGMGWGLKAGLNRERLKHKCRALPCLPYLGFNQPKPLLSQQDFSLPKELCENWGRASGLSSTIAKKQHNRLKRRKISRAHSLRKVFLLDSVSNIQLLLWRRRLTANVVSVTGHETSKKISSSFFFMFLEVRGEFELQVRNCRC